MIYNVLLFQHKMSQKLNNQVNKYVINLHLFILFENDCLVGKKVATAVTDAVITMQNSIKNSCLS